MKEPNSPEMPARVLMVVFGSFLLTLLLGRCGGGGGESTASLGVSEIDDLLCAASSRIVTPLDIEFVELNSGFIVRAARDEVLMALRQDVTEEQLVVIEAEVGRNSGAIIGDDSELRLLQVRVSPDVREHDFANIMQEIPGVQDAFPNMTVALDELPPGFPTPDGFAGSYWIDQIRAREAWALHTGDSDIPIGVVDSGYNPGANVLSPLRIVLLDADGIPLSGNTDNPQGHGTAVTAFVAGDGRRDDGSVGVAWLNRVIHVDAMQGFSQTTTFATTLMSAIQRAVDQGSRLINVSIGPSALSQFNAATNVNFLTQRLLFRDALSPAIQFARRNNALVVLSAGNDGDGGDMNHPVIFDSSGNPVTTVYNDNVLLSGNIEVRRSWESNALVVGSTEEDSRNMAQFSRQGSVIEIAAPGRDVSFGSSQLYSGTSYSAALVTGSAALMLSVNPTLSGAELKKYMLESSDLDFLVLGDIAGGLLDVATSVSTAQELMCIPVRTPLEVNFAASGPESTLLAMIIDVDIVLPSGTITGTVTDSAVPPNPIADALVSLDSGAPVTTAIDGSYIFMGVTGTGGHTVTAAIPGFEAETKSSAGTIGCVVTTVNFALLPTVLPPPDSGPPDVMFTLDTSGSMSEEVAFLKQNITVLLNDLTASFPGIRFGYSIFGEFPQYFLLQPLTNDTSLVADAVLNETRFLGGDGEIALDALFQAMTGAGADGNGDGDLTDISDIGPTTPGWQLNRSRFVMLATDELYQDSDVDPGHPGAGFQETIDAALADEVTVLAIDSGESPAVLAQLTRIVDAVGGVVIDLGSDGTEFVNAIRTGIEGVVLQLPRGRISGVVTDNANPPSPVPNVSVSVDGEAPVFTNAVGAYTIPRVIAGDGHFMTVSAAGLETQLRGPVVVEENQNTTENFVLFPPSGIPEVGTFRLTPIGDAETFLDPESTLLIPGAREGQTLRLVLSFRNLPQKPVRDLDYEFRLHATFGGSLIERIPVILHVPGTCGL